MHTIDTVPFVIFLLIVLQIAGKTLLLKRNRIRTGSKKNSKGVFAFLVSMIFIFLFVIWLMEIMRPLIQVPFQVLPAIFSEVLISSVLLKLAGLIFLLTALIFMFLTLLHFGTSLRFGLDKTNSGKLIEKGVFSHSRNPFFISLEFFFVGTAMILPNPVTCGFTLLAVVAIHFFILREEKFMIKTYGQEYKEYQKKVRRYF